MAFQEGPHLNTKTTELGAWRTQLNVVGAPPLILCTFLNSSRPRGVMTCDTAAPSPAGPQPLSAACCGGSQRATDWPHSAEPGQALPRVFLQNQMLTLGARKWMRRCQLLPSQTLWAHHLIKTWSALGQELLPATARKTNKLPGQFLLPRHSLTSLLQEHQAGPGWP